MQASARPSHAFADDYIVSRDVGRAESGFALPSWVSSRLLAIFLGRWFFGENTGFLFLFPLLQQKILMILFGIR